MNSLRLNVCDAQKHATMYLFHDDAVSVGRSPDNHLVLDHPSVSRHHVRLERHDHGWSVMDLHSTNGTRIGDESIEPYQPCDWSLLEGIQVGEFTLIPQSVNQVDEPTQILMGMDAIRESRNAILGTDALDGPTEPPPAELAVEQIEDFSVTLLNSRPLQPNKRYYLRVHNLGNNLDCFELMQPEAGLVEFVGHEAIFLQANEKNNITFYVQQVNRPMLSMPRRMPFKLNVINQNGMVKATQTDLFIRPLVPLWPLVLCVLSLVTFYILRMLALL